MDSQQYILEIVYRANTQELFKDTLNISVKVRKEPEIGLKFIELSVVLEGINWTKKHGPFWHFFLKEKNPTMICFRLETTVRIHRETILGRENHLLSVTKLTSL